VRFNAIYCVLIFAVWDPLLAAEDIILRTAVSPEDVWVGQKVVLHVDVLAKDGWAQLRKVADADVNGAYLIRLESQGTRLNETIDGDGYTGQRYQFMLFAQRDGKITVPSIPVDVEIRTWGADGGTRTEQMSLPSVEFGVRTPPGAEGIQGLISTGGLAADQSWDPETEDLKVGDAIKRTITLRGDDLSGMAFAPTPHDKIDDLGIYPGEPIVEDRFARGDLVGTRIETVTYVFERAGNFELPSVELTWWDTDSEELRHIVLPGLKPRITGGSLTEPTPLQQAEQQQDKRLWLTYLMLILAVIVGLLVFGGRAAAGWRVWRNVRSEAEAAYFKRIRLAVDSGDYDAVLRETMRWLDRINDNSEPARLDLFLRKYGDARSQESILDQSNAGIRAFLGSLTAARNRWRRAQRGVEHSRDLLPNLNGKF